MERGGRSLRSLNCFCGRGRSLRSLNSFEGGGRSLRSLNSFEGGGRSLRSLNSFAGRGFAGGAHCVRLTVLRAGGRVVFENYLGVSEIFINFVPLKRISTSLTIEKRNAFSH